MLSFVGFGYYCWALKFHCKEQNWSTKCQIHLIWLDFNLDNEHPLAIQISHRKCIEQLKIQKKFKVDALQIAILPRHTSGFSGFVLVLVSFTRWTELINMGLICLDVFYLLVGGLVHGCKFVGKKPMWIYFLLIIYIYIHTYQYSMYINESPHITKKQVVLTHGHEYKKIYIYKIYSICSF